MKYAKNISAGKSAGMPLMAIFERNAEVRFYLANAFEESSKKNF